MMEEFPTVEWDDEGNILVPEGFKDAERLILLKSKEAHKLSDLSLHRQDLLFSQKCLKAINKYSDDIFLQKAMWFAAIASFQKCFGASKSRDRLDSDLIFSCEGSREAYEFFKYLRNKHLIHDENSFMQSLTFAVLNKKKSDHKIAKILSASFVSITLNNENFNNLDLLVKNALKYVSEEYMSLADQVTRSLEKEKHEDLVEYDHPKYQQPSLTDIKKKR